MSNVMDYYLLFIAVNSLNNPIVANTNSIKVLAAFQLNRLMRKRIFSKLINLLQDP